MVVGLHQGFQVNFSRAVLLTSKGKNPDQILADIKISRKKIEDQSSNFNSVLRRRFER